MGAPVTNFEINSADPAKARQFYGDVLNLAAKNQAIVTGDYADLTELNVGSKNTSDKIHSFIRVKGEERLVIVSGFNAKQEHAKIQLSKEAVDKFNLKPDGVYIGRDMLRSGLEIGIDQHFVFELDIPPYSSFIIKIK